MKGDFSRDTFDPRRRISRVLMQQGRVQLDADWNEQVAAQLHLIRTLAADITGPHGGPGEGFSIAGQSSDGKNAPANSFFWILAGHYYIDGWLCDNRRDVLYRADLEAEELPAQPDYFPEAPALQKQYLVYVDAWERHLSSAEVEDLREVALGGADTTSRAQAVWQVKVADLSILPPGVPPMPAPATPDPWKPWVDKHWAHWVESFQPTLRGLLKVSAAKKNGSADKSPCSIPPDSRYRGLENQLYRVEIHRRGAADKAAQGATFKWSRENGSVALPVVSIEGKQVKLAQWWRDDRVGLAEGDWVEIGDDVSSLHNLADPLRRVTIIDRDAMTVTLDETPGVTGDDASRHPVLRRWDHLARGAQEAGSSKLADDNGLYVVENEWLTLEDGVRVYFAKSTGPNPHRYRTGDYWLIPARTIIGDVLWPRKTGQGQGATTGTAASDPDPEERPPQGVEHHYAPLAIVRVVDPGPVKVEAKMRREFKSLSEL